MDSNSNNSNTPGFPPSTTPPIDPGVSTLNPTEQAVPTFQPVEEVTAPANPFDNGLGTLQGSFTQTSSMGGIDSASAQPSMSMGSDQASQPAVPTFSPNDSSGFPSSVTEPSNEALTPVWPPSPVPDNTTLPPSLSQSPIPQPAPVGSEPGGENKPEANTPIEPSDSAPTDLSHLVGNLGGGSVAQPAVSPTPPQTDQLAVPPAQGVPQVVASGSVGFPKWIILVGVLVLLAVAGGSAYFILGIGKPIQPAAKTSTPIVEKETTTGGNSFVPTEETTGGVNDIVNMQLVSPAPEVVTPTITGSTASATSSSALDLLKRRQTK